MPSPPETSRLPRVLIVEDEPKTRASITEGLSLEGWDVAGVGSGDDAIAMVEGERFDLLVLAWMLPDRDGIEVLQHLRGHGQALPVLMLTARTTLHDRLLGLDGGADDYLGKPFAFAELVARCRALLRRPPRAPGRLLRCEDLQLDTRARVAVRAGREIPLTPREVDVLEYLLRNQGQTVTREMLERDVWKQPQRMTSLDNVIDVQIMRLRRKVDGERANRLIHTLRGVGYQLGGRPG
jgi:two-component system copper resistance phosphate regulon response regulator CusR